MKKLFLALMSAMLMGTALFGMQCGEQSPEDATNSLQVQVDVSVQDESSIDAYLKEEIAKGAFIWNPQSEPQTLQYVDRVFVRVDGNWVNSADNSVVPVEAANGLDLVVKLIEETQNTVKPVEQPQPMNVDPLPVSEERQDEVRGIEERNSEVRGLVENLEERGQERDTAVVVPMIVEKESDLGKKRPRTDEEGDLAKQESKGRAPSAKRAKLDVVKDCTLKAVSLAGQGASRSVQFVKDHPAECAIGGVTLAAGIAFPPAVGVKLVPYAAGLLVRSTVVPCVFHVGVKTVKKTTPSAKKAVKDLMERLRAQKQANETQNDPKAGNPSCSIQ